VTPGEPAAAGQPGAPGQPQDHQQTGGKVVARGGSVLLGALIIDAVGNGLFLPLSLVFFLKLTSVSLGVLGALSSTATIVTLPIPVWTGALADKIGALPLVISAQLLQAMGYLAYSWVKEPAGIFAASALVAIGVRVFWSSIFTAIADYADASPAGRTKDSWYAWANTSRTAGLAVGGLVAGAAVADGRDAAYLAIAYAAAASFAVAAVLIGLFVRAPRIQAHDSPSGSGYAVLLRDRPFLGLIAVNTVFALSSLMLPVALPAFMSRGLHGPSWLTASVLAGNAILISVLGAPLTSRLRGFRRTRVLAASGMLWAAWGLLFAFLRPGPLAWMAALLIAATLLFTIADVMHAPISMALAAAAAPGHVRGRYLATFQYSFTFASIIGPVFFTSLFALSHMAPWIGIAILDCTAVTAIVLLERRLPATAYTAAA
jgi:MFS family permease